MSQPSLAPIIPVLQVAVGPVILISGVGLLILSMSNRFGRIIDRTRVLGHELKTADAGRRAWAVIRAPMVPSTARAANSAVA